MSSKEQSSDNSVALFTDIRSHIDWLTQIYNDFSRVTFNQTRICSKYGNLNPTYRKLCLSKYCAILNNVYEIMINNSLILTYTKHVLWNLKTNLLFCIIYKSDT